MRILIAEDDADLNEILVKKLRAEGYAVDSCHNGTDALNYLESVAYDAAVLDIMMPETDGLETVRKLRSKGNMTPVIFLTARNTVSDRVKGPDSGANDSLIRKCHKIVETSNFLPKKNVLINVPTTAL